MEGKLKSLVEVLQKEIRLYEGLRGLCQKEEETVIKGNLKHLDRIVKQQEVIFLHLKNLERARYRLVESLGKSFSPAEKVTLTELCKVADEPYASVLSQLQKRTAALLKEINGCNRNNVFLIEYSIKIIDEYFRLLAGVEEVPVYSSRGKTGRKEQRVKLVDQKS